MRLTVDPAAAGHRLDAYLFSAGACPSANAARRAIAEGRVRLDGRRAPKGARLVAGQEIVLEDAPPPAGELPPLQVLLEDDHLIAVNKPAGVPSQSLRSDDLSVAAWLVARHPECAGASLDPREGGLGHRLDTATSGVLVAARHRAAWEGLRRALGGGESEKVYLAEVQGAPAGQPEGGPWVVTAAIGRTGRRGERVRLDGGRQPLAARTEVALIERRPETSLVEARLAIGRPHQVRAHLAHLGSPVVGDQLYGPARLPDVGLHLHAWTLSVSHPVTGQRLTLRAPPPDWAERRKTQV
jgi:23S rRNA pseudouridine1911/1915/1917 synthase